MKRRQFLAVGTAVLAAPALPSVTADATRHADNRIQTYLDLYDLEPSANKLTAATEALRRMVDSAKIDDWWP
jgi:hypothetical protein